MKQGKKIVGLCLAVLFTATMCFGCLLGCGKSSSGSNGGGSNTGDGTTPGIEIPQPNNTPTDLVQVAEDFSYFGEIKMNGDKHLKVFTNSGNYYDNVLAVVIQGLFAQTESVYYYNYAECSAFWLKDMVDNYGITYENTTVDEMVDAYVEMRGRKRDTGYVLYDFKANPDSINFATTVAAVKCWLPLDKTIADKYTDKLWASNSIDVTNMTYEEVFDEYKDELNNTGVFQLDPELEMPRDYWVANKYFGYYGKYKEDTLNQLFAVKVQSWMLPDAPIFGWGADDEGDNIALNSQYSHFMVGSDTSYNLTVYACTNVFGAKTSPLKQKYDDYKITAQAGKHYVCIVMSDGDNLQASSNTFATGESYYKAVRGDFPMGWTMNASAVDVQPGLLRQMYRETGEKDYFVGAVSGAGYLQPDYYLEEDLITHCSRFNVYMGRADLQTLQIMLSSSASEDVERCIKYYAQMPNLKGGMMVTYANYYLDFRGSVWWANEKPFVGIRASLWGKTGAMIAEQINGYKKDPTSIEGYSLVNVNPWTCTYADVVKMVDNLDDDCIVVNDKQFFELITENVPHVNKILTE